ncbi:LOW QUALITY PROTEIN: hypothetical protein N665_4441s0002 [Sinapis alba]|nr:LOW QUALITY PROTEIN: hypothetical protein N665_4441s0002 [Sinapis alba]
MVDEVAMVEESLMMKATTLIRVGTRPKLIGGPDCSVHIRPGRIATLYPLPSRQFQALFDSLFKSFSYLPRGTCLLSGSRPYLALDGIYRLIGTAFQNNPTRRQHLLVGHGPGTTGLSPSLAPLSWEFGPGPSLRKLLQNTF